LGAGKKIMQQSIKTIRLPLPLKMGSVNCYLLETVAGYFLIDTGSSNQRRELEKELESAGCQPGKLKLILITHGDFDHTGNAAYLRNKFGAKIAMHYDDLGMVKSGDMFWNRKTGNAFLRMIVPVFFGFSKSNRFIPDFYVDEGDDLTEYGFEARVIHIPGHSQGSIGILTAAGDLFCGDLLENFGEPALNSIMDDLAEAKASVEKLKSLGIKTIYPGHGEAFHQIDL